MRRYTYIFLLLLLLAMVSCRTTRYVPDGEYLLRKARVEVTDDKMVSSSQLSDYLRQKQNTEILGFWKLQLDIYNTAPKDTLTKAQKTLTRNAHKMGEAPVIYDEQATLQSMSQIRQAMQNQGYFDARVDTTKVVKRPKQIDLTYRVTAGRPYNISSYEPQLADSMLLSVATDQQRMLIKPGNRFDTHVLDEERERITTAMHNEGFYYFDKALLTYWADSTIGDHEVALQLAMSEQASRMSEQEQQQLYTRFVVRTVSFYIDYDINHRDSAQLHCDSEGDYRFYYEGKKPFMRKRVLQKYCRIQPGQKYSRQNVERSYASLNQLGAVRYVDITFVPVEGSRDELDCRVVVARNKLNSVSAELEGTYSAGDWGIATGLGYANKNIFHGGELLTLNGRVSYEWRQNGGRAIEAKVEAGLTFPSAVKLNLAYNYQQRPDEYTRTIAGAGVYYTLSRSSNSRWTHRFNLIDINYVYLPWMSERFKTDFIDKSSVLKSSYEDHFIVDWSYTGMYSNQRQNQPNRSYINFNYTIETAGNLLYGLALATNLPKNDDGSYVLFKIPFSQYAKADAQFTYHQVLKDKHQLVYHLGVGVAVPYLNAQTMPFEKRYFSGGANSVRGWQARTLGPGAYRGDGNTLVYDLQAGDIRLDLNLEYRWRVWTYIELAAFLDAGNIWTIRDYESQPNGVFRFDEFYKQLAMSYGVGLRFDLSILLLRVDFGVKLHDPSRIYGALGGTQWRTVKNGLGWHDDMTFHIAIGYPF